MGSTQVQPAIKILEIRMCTDGPVCKSLSKAVAKYERPKSHFCRAFLSNICQIHSTTTWTEFCHFLTPSPCVDRFYTLNVDKNIHFYSKREEARLPLLFLSNNDPLFLHPAFCNPYVGPFFRFTNRPMFSKQVWWVQIDWAKRSTILIVKAADYL